MITTFTATMFVTTSYRNCTWKRDSQKTVKEYMDGIEKRGAHIVSADMIKRDKKGGHHDVYAKGDYYKITGTIETTATTKAGIRFAIYHACRYTDYFCCSPVTYNGIKF